MPIKITLTLDDPVNPRIADLVAHFIGQVAIMPHPAKLEVHGDKAGIASLRSAEQIMEAATPERKLMAAIRTEAMRNADKTARKKGAAKKAGRKTAGKKAAP